MNKFNFVRNNLTKTDKKKTYINVRSQAEKAIQLYCKFEFEFE